MKKLLISLLIINGIAFADCNEPANAQKVVNMLHKHNKTAIQVNYTKDKIDCANTCKSNVLALDKTIIVNLNEISSLGSKTSICKFSKPNKG